MAARGRKPTKEMKLCGGMIHDKEGDVVAICGGEGDEPAEAAGSPTPPPIEPEPEQTFVDPTRLRHALTAIAEQHELRTIDKNVVTLIDHAVEERMTELIKGLQTGGGRNYFADVRAGRIVPASTPRHRRARTPEVPRVEGPHTASKRRGSVAWSRRNANRYNVSVTSLWRYGIAPPPEQGR